jgi:hypothetical protein
MSPEAVGHLQTFLLGGNWCNGDQESGYEFFAIVEASLSSYDHHQQLVDHRMGYKHAYLVVG